MITTFITPRCSSEFLKSKVALTQPNRYLLNGWGKERNSATLRSRGSTTLGRATARGDSSSQEVEAWHHALDIKS